MNKSSIIRKTLFFFAIVATLFLSTRIYEALTGDFRLNHITYDMPYHAEWSTPTPSADEETELAKILDQPYSYLAKGAQSYVFASADGKYVLKFFKFKHLRPNFFVNMLPDIGPLSTYKTKQAARKERKLAGVFQSHLIAFRTIPKESGLVFLQMNANETPHRFITIYDKIGFKYTLDLQSYPFVLQKRGITLQESLTALLKDGNVTLAKHKIDQIFAMFATEYAKGIYDEDHGVYRNTGFIGDDAAHLDVGELLANESIKEPAIALKEAIYTGNKLKKWLRQNHRIYANVLSKNIDKSIETHIASNPDAKQQDP